VGIETDFVIALRDYQAVSFDTMIFIYQFEDHPLFAPLTYPLFRALEQDRLSAHVSVLLAGEVLTGPKKTGDQQVLHRYRHVLTSYPNLTLHSVTLPVMEIASDLRAMHNLRTPDAIHVATALLCGAQAFVTNDVRLGQLKVDGLDFLVLSDYVEED
jgi:predicted nucleic acid-binding protein